MFLTVHRNAARTLNIVVHIMGVCSQGKAIASNSMAKRT
jgi:uncharacterized membrane protein